MGIFKNNVRAATFVDKLRNWWTWGWEKRRWLKLYPLVSFAFDIRPMQAAWILDLNPCSSWGKYKTLQTQLVWLPFTCDGFLKIYI